MAGYYIGMAIVFGLCFWYQCDKTAHIVIAVIWSGFYFLWQICKALGTPAEEGLFDEFNPFELLPIFVIIGGIILLKLLP